MEMFFYVRSSAAEDGDGDVYTSEVSEIVSVISSDQYKELKFRHLKKICKRFEMYILVRHLKKISKTLVKYNDNG